MLYKSANIPVTEASIALQKRTIVTQIGCQQPTFLNNIESRVGQPWVRIAKIVQPWVIITCAAFQRARRWAGYTERTSCTRCHSPHLSTYDKTLLFLCHSKTFPIAFRAIPIKVMVAILQTSRKCSRVSNPRSEDATLQREHSIRNNLERTIRSRCKYN